MPECPVCERDAGYRVFHDGEPFVVRCLNCGFAYQPPGRQCTVDYGRQYDLDFAAERRFRYPEERPLHVDIARRIARMRPGAAVLDVGCGDGQFLEVCTELGIEATGIEPSEGLSEYAQRTTGRRVEHGFYEWSSYPLESLEVVTMLQVLEHVPDPRALLRAAHGQLKPGGLLVVDVPSQKAKRMLAYRLTRNPRRLDHIHDLIPSHVSYFSPATLRRLVRSCGFHVEQTVTGRHGADAGLGGRLLDVPLNLAGVGGLLLFASKPHGNDGSEVGRLGMQARSKKGAGRVRARGRVAGEESRQRG